MPIKRKTGEYFTYRQFFQQFKKGMEEVTPLQQCFFTQLGQIVSFIGVVWGIVFSIILGYWWMAVILSGGIIILSVQMLANWQKKSIHSKIEKMYKEAEIKTELIQEEIKEPIKLKKELKEVIVFNPFILKPIRRLNG